LFQDVFLIGGLGITRRKDLAESKIRYTFAPGEMAEWSIAAVLKTVELRGSGGSNPSLSAINVGNQQITKQTPNFTPNNVKLGVFVLFKKTAERLCIDQ
jgi:hypothetical protein